MDDRIRASDADRDRIADRLRDHFAEGRLTPEELDERVTATLNAKTLGDLRHVMTDLPEAVLAPRQATQLRPQAGHPGVVRRRGPRVLPLAALALFAALLLSGPGPFFLAFFRFLLAFWLVACIAGIFVAARFRRRMRRHWQHGGYDRWQDWPAGYVQHRSRCWRT